jgi:hypothetical protein
MRIIRCKVRVTEILSAKNPDGSIASERVSLAAVYGEQGSENEQWSKWTPAADFRLTISNPAAFGTLSQGHEFYVDFIPCALPAAGESTAE